MKLSELLAELRELEQSHGDMPVVWFGPGRVCLPDLSVMDLPELGASGPAVAITAGEVL